MSLFLIYCTALLRRPVGAAPAFFSPPQQRRWTTKLSVSSALITNPKSNTIQKIQKLLNQRKKRTEFQQVVVEGPRSVLDLVQNQPQLVHQIVMDVDDPQDYTSVIESHVRQQTKHPDISIQYTTRSILDGCSEAHQGILAICHMPRLVDDDDDGSSSTNYNYHSNNNNGNHHENAPISLVLDGLQDPGNVGTLIRSAVASGMVRAVYLLPNTCDPWNPKALRSSMGTAFGIPLVTVTSWSECQRQLLETVSHIYAAALLEEDPTTDNNNNMRYDQVLLRPGETIALVIGSEGTGLTKDVRQALAENKQNVMTPIYVPMMNASVESLNAAICGSIILFEWLRQHQQQAVETNG